ncbi:MAG TPA: hypothetical protein VJH03_12720 [Blastocatellia bacterium]|nr:hypothetical protein [Blastocatellia bacterium]
MNKPLRMLPAASAILFLAGVLFATTSAPASMYDDKMKPEDLIAKHLESIGSAQARAAAVTREITGKAVVTFRQGGRGQLYGDARLLSDHASTLTSMIFDNIDYPHEKMGYDGKRLTVTQVKPGVRSLFGRYLLTNQVPFSEGLIGGTLSPGWALLDVARKAPKLKYDGIKKIDKRELHQLKYAPRKNEDLVITLFFDPQTFQHVRTRYHQLIDPKIGSNRPADSLEEQETRIDIVEEFSDFRTEAGLTLPHTYKITLAIEGRSTVVYDWVLTLTQFTFGQAIDPREFNVDAE